MPIRSASPLTIIESFVCAIWLLLAQPWTRRLLQIGMDFITALNRPALLASLHSPAQTAVAILYAFKS